MTNGRVEKCWLKPPGLRVCGVGHIGVEPKNRGKTPKMDGENKEHLINMDDLGGKNHPYFWVDTHRGSFLGKKNAMKIWQRTNLQSMMEDPANQAPMSTGGVACFC